jgi:hypothetical protein
MTVSPKSLTVVGKFETDLDPALTGSISANIHDEVEPYSRYVNIIEADDYWYVTAHWFLHGSIRRMICGYWCVRLFLESLGKDVLDLELSNDEGLIPLDPCGDGEYTAHFKVKPYRVTVEQCGTPFKPVLTVQYLTSCRFPYKSEDDWNAAPACKRFLAGPIAGFVEFPVTEFIYEKIEV